MPGAHIHESVRFEVDSIQQAMEQIKRLQGTGRLTINFADGKPNGFVEWNSKLTNG